MAAQYALSGTDACTCLIRSMDLMRGIFRRSAKKAAQKPMLHDFGNTREADVLARMPFEEKVVIRKGFFPETAQGLEKERYAVVSLDVDLYAPTFAGLEYFYPKLNEGGAIVLHDYNSLRFDGVRRAVADYERKYGRLDLIPLSDLHGTAIIVKPWNERKCGVKRNDE